MAEDKGLSRSQREEKVLQFWKDNKIFDKTLEKKAPEGDFVFYEGPPTANGRPGIHHLESRAFKDAIPRYKTMRGYRVPRKAGWDTHGLPVELAVEKQLGLKSKKEIEEYGVEKFNEECRKSVAQYIDEWAKFTDRIGYWTDLGDAYYTYDNSYIEKVWGVIAETNKRKLLYKDYKVVPWCPRCGTGLSSHELAQPDAYKEIKDLSIYAKFKIVGFPDAYFVAWTTTPWTLPGNIALAVGKDITYVEAKVGNEILVVAKDRLEVIKEPFEIVAEHKGAEMAGMAYEPLFPFVKDKNPDGIEKAFKVYTADFVNTEDGTGIVHTAVMYGQDDFELGTKVGLPKAHLVDDAGNFMSGTGFLEGRYVRETDENGKPTLAVDIIDDLKKRGLFYAQENIKHSYPHCWRCQTPLIYYARNSWYIRMSELRDKLVKENGKINWEPEHIKEGRFGEWLREVKDWAISRERYWGTPLPVWESADGEKIVVDSLETLRKYSKGSNNTYTILRHGQAENNVRRIVSTRVDNPHGLSELGREQVAKSAGKLNGIDIIVASPFRRTKETAEIAAQKLGIPMDAVIFDERLMEFDAGVFEGKTEDELHDYLHSRNMFAERCDGGENFAEAKLRVGEALADLERTYSGKRILIVTHKIPAWLLVAAGKRLRPQESEALDIYLSNAELHPLAVETLPHDKNFELDLHKPFIDGVVLVKDGKEYRRTKEVMDVWLDSGAMPFAQYGKAKKFPYPADFISEAIDQTRGWFYTLHAVGVLMGEGRAYKNVICLGHILDKEGKKMSKSLGNVVNPWDMIEKYGVDVLRLWMYSVNQPGESKNFDERSVDELNKRVFNLLDNVYTFYELYRDKALEDGSSPNGKNILDKWILVRLSDLVREMTEDMDGYRLLEPVRAMREFIDDLSTWYLRRSRERLKDGDAEAKRTLYFVLKTLSKLMAPFAPFAAEDLYQKLRTEGDAESVHLTSWPKSEGVDVDLDSGMKFIRGFASMAHMQRSAHDLKIRQPLQSLSIKHTGKAPKYWEELSEILADEVNVKEIILDSRMGQDEPPVKLDTALTPELEEEGRVREIIRSIQEVRKERGLTPGESMSWPVPDAERGLYEKHAEAIKRATSVEYISESV